MTHDLLGDLMITLWLFGCIKLYQDTTPRRPAQGEFQPTDRRMMRLG